MAVPTYDRFIEPILRFLATRPDGVPAREAHEAAADILLLTESDRELALPTGQATYKNRAGWAHDRLKRAGYSASPKHGIWRLTEAGRKFIADNPAPLSALQVEALARNYLDVKLKPSAHGPSDPLGGDGPAEEVQSPDDRLQMALGEIRASVRSELLDLLLQISPKYFETVVLDLLHKLGYGTSRSDLQRVGGSGDGGIDGVISLDRLGLEKVYVQAKRWQSVVGRPEIQGFYGALAGQRANKGVFLTTSSFTAQAVDFARSVERIVLVDGATLANLMMDNEVGVSSQSIRIPKIDSDYFDE
ncbi:restriction endonuclease [Luteimonas sp. MC1750]|nr:restriction endonuclease [Luteimonas sp. MC1750]QQO07195.1 restriction endonuclease [Luteimonas sp. MC1750]